MYAPLFQLREVQAWAFLTGRYYTGYAEIRAISVPRLARDDPEDDEIHDEEQGKEDGEGFSFSFVPGTKPVDEPLHTGKKTAGRDDGDDAGIEKIQIEK